MTQMKLLLLILLASSLVTSSFGYQGEVKSNDTPQPDRWHGLILDESTPEDAVKVLGKPSEDKPQPNNLQHIDPRLSKAKVNMRDLSLRNRQA